MASAAPAPESSSRVPSLAGANRGSGGATHRTCASRSLDSANYGHSPRSPVRRSRRRLAPLFGAATGHPSGEGWPVVGGAPGGSASPRREGTELVRSAEAPLGHGRVAARAVPVSGIIGGAALRAPALVVRADGDVGGDFGCREEAAPPSRLWISKHNCPSSRWGRLRPRADGHPDQ